MPQADVRNHEQPEQGDSQMNDPDPNIIAGELPDDVRAAARSLGQSPQAALEHRLGWRALALPKAAVRRSCQAAAALDLGPPPAPPDSG